ncbi:hypothetical protein D4764_16G0010310 [Takifugu flavidus]|uniref:Uncharacterized protein n=1 Tax=Takifugu flavidus TaxID=433684 RepID=A0A5C6NYG1_9TELE|nr:hypothetical protein D4764_16G0010310 [Takifugu flavidus]
MHLKKRARPVIREEDIVVLERDVCLRSGINRPSHSWRSLPAMQTQHSPTDLGNTPNDASVSSAPTLSLSQLEQHNHNNLNARQRVCHRGACQPPLAPGPDGFLIVWAWRRGPAGEPGSGCIAGTYGDIRRGSKGRLGRQKETH